MAFSLKRMFSGSGWKRFKGVVGGLGGLALNLIPGLGTAASGLVLAKVGGLAGKLGAADKLAQLPKGVNALRKVGKVASAFQSTAQVLHASPVMPGGAISTPGGMAMPMVNPPAFYGGSGVTGYKRKRRKTTKKRASSVKGRRTTKKRTSSGRKLKFGSPAWRKKYAAKARKGRLAASRKRKAKAS
jgi:hypothetical protein